MKIFAIPGLISAFSLIVIWAALQLDLSPEMIVGDSMQPRVFPVFLMIINLVLAAFLTIQYRKNPPKKLNVIPIIRGAQWRFSSFFIS